LECDYEIIFIDDGSRDGSRQFLAELAAVDSAIKVLAFSRNFGHQAAITAGLDFAEGDAIVVMDADLQDPPELLAEMLTLYRQGFDVVSPQRVARDEGLFKRGAANVFYALMRRAVSERLPAEVGDFRLFSRAAVDALRSFREQHRFVRGLVAWLGMKEAIIPFRRPRRVAGTTKYPLWKMLQFAWTAISSFSALPLKLSLIAGLLVAAFGLLYSLYVVYVTFVLQTTVPGWSSIVCLQILFSGATLAAVGLVGSYVALLYEEIKGRPLYVVAETMNCPDVDRAPPRTIRLERRRATAETPFTDPMKRQLHANGPVL
jgi:dolichol-phosphate mannosyltransferase